MNTEEIISSWYRALERRLEEQFMEMMVHGLSIEG